MPKKGENIYKRKDGRWEGRYKTTLTNLVSADHVNGVCKISALSEPDVLY